MVKNHENAYRLKNLLLFAVECGQQKIWGKLASMAYPHVGGVLQNNFCFTGCPEKLPKLTFLEPLIATFIIQSLNYFFSYKGLQK